MKITVCDLCHIEGKVVKSDYRWGYKGGFKLDLCKFHVDKKNNPFTGMRQEEAQIKFFSMRHPDVKVEELKAPELITKMGW